MIRRRLAALAAGLLALSGPAEAAWKEVRSRNFIVYGEEDNGKLQRTAADLERYWFMLRFVSGAKPKPGAVPIRIYVMPNTIGVGNSLGIGNSAVAGYYSVSPRGPIAVTTRRAAGDLSAQLVLFHELAHHFMFDNFPAAYPAWYSEGFADYYGSARILDKDTIEVGHAVSNRYIGFDYLRWIPVQKLLVAKSYADVDNIFMLYAEGWLLTHYLARNVEGSRQLRSYLAAINAGRSYADAAKQAFGDTDALDKALHAYSRQGRLQALSLPFKPIDVGPITIRTMAPAENAMMFRDIQLRRGLRARETADFAKAVAGIARDHPNDAHALSMLAEAQVVAGERTGARATIDHWLAARPNDPDALMLRGSVAAETLKAEKITDTTRWDAARADILAADHARNGDPRILLAYYRSFQLQGVLPPPGAQNALIRAMEKLPQDDTLRYLAAADFEQRGMIDEAITIIRPAAYELHGEGEGEQDPRKRAAAEEARKREREAEDLSTETAREMLVRLERRQAAARKP